LSFRATSSSETDPLPTSDIAKFLTQAGKQSHRNAK